MNDTGSGYREFEPLSIDEPEESSNAWTLAELEDSADLGSLQAAWTGNDERYA